MSDTGANQSGRFLPAYVSPTGSLTTKRTNFLGVKNPRHRKRYYWDTEANEYITQRQYIVRSQGWTPEARTRASKQMRVYEAVQGRTLPGRSIFQRQRAFQAEPEQRTARRQQALVGRFVRARQREGQFVSPVEAETSQDFADAWRRVRELERERRRLRNAGLDDTIQYRALVAPDGEYAALLAFLGVRDPDSMLNVGDS